MQLRAKLKILVSGSLLFLVGCGPVTYIRQVTVQATQAMAAAKQVKAEELAPYEFWLAKTYLEWARETAGYSNYQFAVYYGQQAESMALKARKLAVERAESHSSPTNPDLTKPDSTKPTTPAPGKTPYTPPEE